MYSLAKCIEVLGIGCLTDEQMKELIRILDKSMKDHFERAAKRQEQRKDEDYDEVFISFLSFLSCFICAFYYTLFFSLKFIVIFNCTIL